MKTPTMLSILKYLRHAMYATDAMLSNLASFVGKNDHEKKKEKRTTKPEISETPCQPPIIPTVAIIMHFISICMHACAAYLSF